MHISVRFKLITHTAIGKTKDGKKRQKTFSQTLNPFNKNSNGEPKSEIEIRRELIDLAGKWIHELKSMNAVEWDEVKHL